MAFSLTRITISDSVTSIEQWAFGGGTGLTSITIADGITSIGRAAFSHCSGLTSVTTIDVDALNPVYSSFEGALLNKTGSEFPTPSTHLGFSNPPLWIKSAHSQLPEGI